MKLAEDDFELSSRVTEEIEGTLSYNMEYWLTHQKKDDPKTGDTTYTSVYYSSWMR